MKAAVFEGPEQITIQELPDPVAGPDDIVVQVSECGICGSDLHSYLEGAFIAPGQVMGHEFSGPITQVGANVQGLKVGDRVTAVPLSTCGRCPRCLEGAAHLCETGLAASVAYGLPGAFAEYVRVPDAILGGNVHLIPDNVSYAAAALVEPLAVGLHAAKSANPLPTDTCVVIGLGSIGLNCVQMLKACGAGRVIGIDISPARLELARSSAPTSPSTDARRTRSPDPGDHRHRRLRRRRARRHRDRGIGGAVAAGRRHLDDARGRQAAHRRAVRGHRAHRCEPDRAEGDERGRHLRLPRRVRAGAADAVHGVTAEPLISHTFPLEQAAEAFRAQLSKESSIKVQIAPR